MPEYFHYFTKMNFYLIRNNINDNFMCRFLLNSIVANGLNSIRNVFKRNLQVLKRVLNHRQKTKLKLIC